MENLVAKILFFFMGLLFGSFFNVVGLRVPLHQSIIFPPSHCPGCQKRLSPFDLVPVFSFLLTRGRCRYCQQSISPIYPVMEGLTGILFLFAYTLYGWSFQLVFVLFFISMLIMITVSDLSYQIIPDKILFPFFLLFILYFLWFPPQNWMVHLLGMALGFLVFYLVAVLSRGGMGGGDIKLYAVAGFVLGYPLLFVSILLATVTGALFGLILMFIKKGDLKSGIPFGPFIAAGSLVAIFWGEKLLAWYWGMFNV